MQELIGQTLGQYKIAEKIGQGGMATVFKAWQPGLERWVAVKVLPPFYAADPHFSHYFMREARAIAQLEHPHILPVYDFGQQGAYFYLVMRYIEGSRTLADVMSQPFSLTQALNYLDQVAVALDYAHERGIIHRDIKPTNILLSQNWVFLADFGLARGTDMTRSLTVTDMAMGTPAYMSPEQGSGDKVDARTDVYALGVIIYELLTGQIPHVAETAQAIIYKRNHEPAPSLRNVRSDLPKSVAQVVQKALAPNPAQRFRSAGELVATLRQAVQAAKAGHLLTHSRQIFRPGSLPSPDSARICPHCGTTVAANTSICPNCGGSVDLPTLPVIQRQAYPSWWLMGGLGLLLLMVVLIGTLIWLVARPFNPAQSAGPQPGATEPSLLDPTPVLEPTPTLEPTLALEPTPTLTLIPAAPTATTSPLLGQNCERGAADVFTEVWRAYRRFVGCPRSELRTLSTIAEESFQGGHLFWIEDTDQVYIIYDRQKNGGELAEGQWQLADPSWKWDGSNPEGVGLSPPPGLVEPKRGFGWLWRNHLGGPEGPLGWALDREYGFDNVGQVQVFEQGLIFKGSFPKNYVLLDNGTFYAR